jgi:hypothetical protein
MNENGVMEKGRKGRKRGYRDMLRVIRECLRPIEPGREFTLRLEEMCESMGARELFLVDSEPREEGGHRGILIGGVMALPFVGVAAYAIRKHVLRRRVVPLGI